MKRTEYEILRISGAAYCLPIFLEDSIKEMGIMVGFDGEIEQLEQFCNFSYSGLSYSLYIYNTLNTNKLKELIDAVFTVSWGDGTPNVDIPMLTMDNIDLPYATHTYLTGGTYNVEITVNSPWKVEKVKKTIVIPFINDYGFPTDFGTLTFEVPYSNPITNQTQDYLEDYTALTGETNNSTISFIGIGKSRLDEFQEYGTGFTFSGITTGTTEEGSYTGYTIDDLFYMDYADGYTHITGTTSGTTITFFNDEVYAGMITRNEHLIGFVEEPTIYSDIFVERGKQSVSERNLRLGEIDSVGEIVVYGNGFFNVKKQ